MAIKSRRVRYPAYFAGMSWKDLSPSGVSFSGKTGKVLIFLLTFFMTKKRVNFRANPIVIKLIMNMIMFFVMYGKTTLKCFKS